MATNDRHGLESQLATAHADLKSAHVAHAKACLKLARARGREQGGRIALCIESAPDRAGLRARRAAPPRPRARRRWRWRPTMRSC